MKLSRLDYTSGIISTKFIIPDMDKFDDGSISDGIEYDDSNSDEDAELDDVHGRLVNAIDRFAKQSVTESDGVTKKVSESSALSQNSKENGYIAGTVSMDALLNALSNGDDQAKGLEAVKKKLAAFEKSLNEKGSNRAPLFVDKVVSQRLERGLVYDGTSKDMTKWQELVVSNRHLRTLDLAQDNRKENQPSCKALVAKFAPVNDMEREIQMVLVDSGADDKSAGLREADELEQRHISAEEFMKRQAELAKVKARMFFDQMKRHRANKIKSKAYHRIKKKQKLRQERDGQLLDANDADAVGDKATKRIKERMDLRHRNSGKWARNTREHAHGNKSMKEAYNESIKLGQELLEKSTKANGNDSDEDSNASRSDWSSGDSEAEDNDNIDNIDSKSFKRQRNSASVARKAAKALNRVFAESSDADEGPELSGRYKKLFEMDFMKKAKENQILKAKEDVQNILLELEEMENASGGESDGDSEKKINSDKLNSEIERNVKIAKNAMEEHFGSKSGSEMLMKKGFKGKATSSSASIAAVSSLTTASEIAKSKVVTNLTSNEVTEETADVNLWLLPVKESIGRRTIGSDSNRRSSDATMNQSVAEPLLAASSSTIHGKKCNKSSTNISSGAISSADANVDININANVVTAISADKSANAIIVNTSVNSNSHSISKISNCSNSNSIGNSSSNSSNYNININISSSNNAFGSNNIVATNSASSAKPAIISSERKPLLMQKSQADLVQMAFSGPNLEEEFAAYKAKAIGDELGFDDKRKKVLSQVKAGWGDWAGPGEMKVSAKIKGVRDHRLKQIAAAESALKSQRRDTKPAMANVVISERTPSTSARYQVVDVPHPFSSREEYERSLQMPLGSEWNASHVVAASTKPQLLLRAGRIVEPIKMAAESQAQKRKRASEAESDRRNATKKSAGKRKIT